MDTTTVFPHAAAWPPDLPFEMPVPQRTLWDVFCHQAEEGKERLALDFLGRAFDWGDLRAEAEHLAAALQCLGVAAGDRVLLFAQNCPQFVVAFHAVLRCGAVVVPANPMYKAMELAHCLQDSGARVAIAAADIAPELAAADQQLTDAGHLAHLITFQLAEALGDLAQVPAVWRDWLTTRHPLPETAQGQVHDWTALVGQHGLPAPVASTSDDLALLMYTSGTTGHPKACMHSHRTILANAMQPAVWQDLRREDAALVALPMFHITGLVGGLLGTIYAGARVVLLPRWDRRTAAQAIASHRVTHWTNIPTMVVDLLADPGLADFDLSSLRYIGGGGATMPLAVAQALKSRFGLDYVEGYGLTETAAPSHANPRHAPRFQCLGIPILNTRARVIDPETLADMPVGEAGEIVVSGPQVFLGYWHNPEATAQAFVEHEGRRWFRTGDLGRRDEDGYYHIADRIKRMINASGFKVWPAEVEAMLHQHPAIQEACIIAQHDPYRGQSVRLLAVLKPAARGSTTAQDIIDWARQHMAAYKVPRDVEFTESLPKSGTGKVMWRALQARQDERDAGGV